MKKNMILIKVLVALIGISVTVTIFFLTPLWGAAILLSVLSALSAYELCVPTGVAGSAPVTGVAVLTAALVPWLFYFCVQQIAIPLAYLLMLAFMFLYEAAHDRRQKSQAILFLSGAALLFPGFFSLLLPILSAEKGKVFVLLPFTVAWSTDTFAQLFGKLFGKRKLAPKVSPNKTVAGLFGGLFGGVFGAAIYWGVLQFRSQVCSVAAILLLGLLGAAFASIGDLFFSYIKRESGVKDFGSLMPAHGGVLDRFDSVLFVLPLFYAWFHVFI